VADYEERIPLSEETLREYLTGNITLDMDENMQAGLNEFFRLAHKHGLIPAIQPTTYLSYNRERVEKL
jgi:hypothetical protein